MNGIKRLGAACAVAMSAATLGACVDDGYGGGGVAVGYAPGYDGYHDGYYGAYGDPYAGGAYPGYYGWYGGFYYPGSGFYVYDLYRRPYRWNGDQRRYWGGQQRSYRASVGVAGSRGSDNWAGFRRGGGTAVVRPAGQAFRGGHGAHGGHGGHRR